MADDLLDNPFLGSRGLDLYTQPEDYTQTLPQSRYDWSELDEEEKRKRETPTKIDLKDLPAEGDYAIESMPPPKSGKINIKDLPESGFEMEPWYAYRKSEVNPTDYDTKLTPEKEAQFQEWKNQVAPKDSGEDYDYRGAFEAGSPGPGADGHMPDRWKKPNHPTFSDESKYAEGVDTQLAGKWVNGEFVAPAEPEMGGPREFYNRIERGVRTGTEDVNAGFNQQIAEAFRSRRNPYLFKSIDEAKADVPKLEQQIKEANERVNAIGEKETVTDAESLELRRESPKISALYTQLDQAREAAKGNFKEGFAGSLSRAAEDVAESSRGDTEKIKKDYLGLISEKNNEQFWNKVADSIGGSLPTTGAAMLNPVFGLALMYTQTYEQSRSEYLERGGDPAKAHEYATRQASVQTPFEIVGDVAFARLAKGALAKLVKDGTPESFKKWITEQAIELGKATAGETLVTTPAQTVLEQSFAEQYGIRDPTTIAQKAAQAAEASKVAFGQSLLMGGVPIGVGAAHGQAFGHFIPEAAPAGTTIPPAAGEVPPATAPPPASGAVPPGAPGITITPAPGEVVAPPGLTAAPPPVYQPGQSVRGANGATGTVTQIQPEDGTVMVDWGNGPEPTSPGALQQGEVAATADDERFAPPDQESPGAHEVRLAAVNEQLAVEPDPARRQELEGERAILENKIQSRADVEVVQDTVSKLQETGSPKTAEALQKTAAVDLEKRDVDLHEQVQAITPPEVFAPEQPVQPTAAPAPTAPEAAKTPAQPVQAAAPAPETRPQPAPTAVEPVRAVAPPVAAPPQVPYTPSAPKAKLSPVAEGHLQQATEMVRAGNNEGAKAAASQALGLQVDERPIAPEWYKGTNKEWNAQRAANQAYNNEIKRRVAEIEMVASPERAAVYEDVVEHDGHEAAIVRPSEQIEAHLKGLKVEVPLIDESGKPQPYKQRASEALMDLKKDKTAFELLINCLQRT